MIVEALRTGFIEGARQALPAAADRDPSAAGDEVSRVAPTRSPPARTSIEAAARLKARMLMFADRPWPLRLPGIERYRALYRAIQRRRGAAGGDRRSVRLRRHFERGERTGRTPHGQLRRQQPRTLRADEHAFRHREGLRRLCEEVGAGARRPGATGW